MSGFTDLRLIVADGTTWLGEVDVYESATVVARFNAVSSWELVVPSKSQAAEHLLGASHPRLVVTTAEGVVFRSGPATNLAREVTLDGDMLTVSGVDDLAWLRGRLAHPTPTDPTPPYSGQARDTRTGAASQVIAQYVDFNAGPSAVTARRVSGLTVATPAAFGPSVTVSARYQNLLELVSATAERAGLGIEIRDLEFAVFQPAGPTAVFSQGLGTLAGWTHTVAAPEINYVYVAGSGGGVSRIIRESSDTASVAEWGRWEGFADRRDTGDTVELDETGAEVLAEIPAPELTLEALETSSQGFLVDWHLGDTATAFVDDQEITDVIREVTVTLEANTPPTVVPTIGGAPTVSLNLFRRLDRYDRRIRQLERTEPEAGGGGGDHPDSDHTTFAALEHDTAHDDRFSLLAHTHAAHPDSDHDDRFSLLAHLHTATYAPIAAGVPVGGTTGQVLTKISATNYDASWQTGAAHADTDHDDRFVQLPGAWQTPTLLNSWVNFGGVFQTARYRKENDVVVVEGLIKSGTMTSGTVLFNLPAGYRPVGSHVFNQPLAAAVDVRVDVVAGGDVALATAAGTNTFLSLDGIRFAIT